MSDVSPKQFDQLWQAAQAGTISRRTLVRRAAILGVSGSTLISLLAACGGDDDDDAPATTTQGGAATQAATTATNNPPQTSTATSNPPSTAAPSGSPAAAAGDVVKGGKLTTAVTADPSTLDCHVNSNTRDTIFHHALYDHLLQRSPDGTLYPALATEWEVASDGVTWTLGLRDDVKFHDGEPFNAEAVVFNLDRIVDPATKSEYAVFQLGPYESSSAVDEFTVEVVYSEPYGPFLVSLATYGIGMMSPAAVEKHGDQIGFNPVGSGPFMFKEWVPQSHVTFVKNPDYAWPSPIDRMTGEPALDEVTFRVIAEAATRTAAVLSGEVDFGSVGAADFGSFEDDDNFVTQKLLTEGYPPAGIFVNVTKTPTDDVLVRRALEFGVDRHEVNEIVYEGHAGDADSVISNFAWAYDPASALYSYDPEQAESLLEEAGWTMGSGEYREKDGEELKIVFLSLTGVKAVAEVVQAQLKDIGVNAELLVLDNPAQQQTAQRGEHNLVWTQWSGVDPGDLRKIYHSENIGSGWNFCHYDNPDVDQMFVDGAATNDVDERKAIYSKLQMTLMEDATFIPLNNNTTYFAMKPSVKGTDIIDERGSNPRIYNFWIDESAG